MTECADIQFSLSLCSSECFRKPQVSKEPVIMGKCRKNTTMKLTFITCEYHEIIFKTYKS
jgi:hypothetical protein